MKRATLVLAALALLLGGKLPETRAGFIAQNASTSITWDVLTAGGARDVGSSDGTSSVSKTITVQDIFGDTSTADASASAGGTPWVLVTQANVTMNAPALGLGTVPTRSTALASWQDIMFLSNSDPSVVGNTLRLSFHATGSFAFNGGSAVLYSQKDVSYDTGRTYDHLGVSADNPYNWDSLTSSNGSYTGTFHVDVPILYADYTDRFYHISMPGSIWFELSAYVQNDSFVNPYPYDTVNSEASDPFQFVSITLPDKGNVTPESLGVSVTFDSGLLSPNLQPQAVPEPSSLALLAFGGVSLLGYTGLRRRRKVAAA